MRQSSTKSLGPEKLQFNYKTQAERLKSSERRRKVYNHEPLNAEAIAFPCFRHTSKEKWLRPNDFQLTTKTPKGASAWRATSVVTEDPYREQGESIFRIRTKEKELGGTWTMTQPLDFGLKSSRSEGSPAFEGRVYKKSLDEPLNKLYFTGKYNGKFSFE